MTRCRTPSLPPLPKAARSVSLPAHMRRWWPETLLAWCLRSRPSWAVWARSSSGVSASSGRRPRRSTPVDHNHWLVAEIQGRPRLEKPPLPRWSIAALIKLTGCRDEWTVRLPGAIMRCPDRRSHLRVGIANGRPRARPGVRVWSSARRRSLSGKCARPAMTARSRFSRRSRSMRPGAGSSRRANGHRRATTRLALLNVRNRRARLAGPCCFTAHSAWGS